MRDYDEIWHYPGYDVIRKEKGLPVKIGNSIFNSDIDYQYSDNESNLFNARFSLNVDDVPNKEEGDRHSLLTTSDNNRNMGAHFGKLYLAFTLTIFPPFF